ncbi:tyrosine-type recombinase/integrase [Brotaphodocola sp.]|uniref:tyrosine-type recombinase/integrase n=1 Tax=Brotaphodocola sp. TaxID=3073577 RepID=UPI003D7C4539
MNEICLREMCSYISEETENLFLEYTARFIRQTTRRQYAGLLALFCRETKCDFMEITPEKTDRFFRNHTKSSTIKTLQWQIAALRGFARFIDEKQAAAQEEEQDQNQKQDQEKSEAQEEQEVEGAAGADRVSAKAQFQDVPAQEAKDAQGSETTANPEGHFESAFPKMQFEWSLQPIAPIPKLEHVDQVLTYFYERDDLTMFVAISTILRCGLTTRELCGLNVGHIFMDADGKKGMIIPDTHRRERKIKIPDDLFDLIVRLIPAQAEKDFPVFRLRRFEKRLSARMLEHYIKDACEALEIPPFTMTQLRNLAVASMVQGGAPAQAVSDYLGTDILWITRYDVAVPELKDSAVDYHHIYIKKI